MAGSDGVAIFRASVRGAGREGFRLSRIGEEIQRELEDEVHLLSEGTAAILEEHAPHDTGKLDRELSIQPRVRASRISFEIHSEAEDEGFNYTRVTRFGHLPQRRYIYPTRGRFLRVVFGKDDIALLPRVRAYHPARDWVADAMPEIDREAERSMNRIERAIDTRILR